MPHTHDIIDTDCHFLINPVTRTIGTKSDKLCVVQFDHGSERFTFQMPRYVEEHDMSMCDRIEIHYTNIIRTKKQQNDDVYIVRPEDCTFDRDTLFFSWLVTGNATQLVGTLRFSVTFLCHDDAGYVIYEWGTTQYEGVQVLAKNRSTDIVIERYPDLYNQLKEEILNSIPPCDGDVDAEEVERIILEYFENNPPAQGEPGYSPTVDVESTEVGHNITITDVNGAKTVEVLNGTNGKDGVSPTIVTEETESGYNITITDANGSQTFTINHGTNSSTGEVDAEEVRRIVDEHLEANPPIAAITINGVGPDENGNFNLDDFIDVTTNNAVDF